MKQFKNGFTSWQETHFEIVQAITIEWMKDSPSGKVYEAQMTGGHGALYELAEELTDKFESIHEGRDWDGDFFDVIEEFINENLK